MSITVPPILSFLNKVDLILMKTLWGQRCLGFICQYREVAEGQCYTQGQVGSESPDLRADLRLCDNAVWAEPSGVAPPPAGMRLCKSKVRVNQGTPGSLFLSCAQEKTLSWERVYA